MWSSSGGVVIVWVLGGYFVWWWQFWVACFVSEKTDRLRGRARKTDEEEDRRRVVAKKIEPVVKWQIEIDKLAFCDVKG